MRLLFVLVCFYSTQVFVIGQYIKLTDARSLGLASAIDATGENYQGFSNPAGLVGNNNMQIAAHYYNRFMLPELGVQGMSIIAPVWKGSFAGKIGYFGTRELNQSSFIISYGHGINPWLAAGVDLNYHSQSIKALQERRSTITGNLGVIVWPMKELAIGMYCINLTRSAYNFYSGEETGTSLRTGITYSETEKFLVACSLSLMDFQWIDIALGSEVFLNNKLVLRGGIKLPSSMSYSFGTGIFFSWVDCNLGFEQHPVLGLSSSVSIMIQIKQNGKR